MVAQRKSITNPAFELEKAIICEEVQAGLETGVDKLENKALRIQVFRVPGSSFFARPTPLIFYSSLDWGTLEVEAGTFRGPPKIKRKGDDDGG